ncbi:MAG: M48 family metalloprotease, partial [Chitinophagales bacterium]
IGQVLFSWQTILLLIFAPTLSNFLELAISRTREFEADRAAAYLTGKPEALASALHKLEQINRREQWGQMLRVQVPDVLLSHPNTKERINRLLSIHKQLFEVSF